MFTQHTDKPVFWQLHDGPTTAASKGQKFLERYLCDAQAIFKEELDMLFDTKREFSEIDEVRLSQMLALLIEARRTWQEEENTINAMNQK